MKLLFMNKVIIIMKARSIIMILNKILRRTIAYNLDEIFEILFRLLIQKM